MKHINVVARRSDPETSHQAALDFEAKQAKAQHSVEVVVTLLCRFGPLTDFELRRRWEEVWGDAKWSFTLPSKARHWAREQGLVRHDGFGDHQGRRVRRWALGRDDKFLEPHAKCPTCGHRISS